MSRIFWRTTCFRTLGNIVDTNCDVAQEILALTGGGKTREYTETRPDGSTVTYTIDVEEEEYEVLTKERALVLNFLQEEVEMEITTTRTVKTMEFTMEGQGGGRTMEIIREGGGGGEMTTTRSSGGRSMEIIREGGGGEMTMTRSSTTISGGGGGEMTVTKTSKSGGSGFEVSKVS